MIKCGREGVAGRRGDADEGGAELKMRARILVMGLDRVKQVRVLVDRRSTGVIESDFIHKLEARHASSTSNPEPDAGHRPFRA